MVDREITSLVPRPLIPLPVFDHLQYAKMGGKPGINCHVSDVNVHQVDRGGEGPDCKNVFNSRQTTSVTYGALLTLHKHSTKSLVSPLGWKL